MRKLVLLILVLGAQNLLYSQSYYLSYQKGDVGCSPGNSNYLVTVTRNSIEVYDSSDNLIQGIDNIYNTRPFRIEQSISCYFYDEVNDTGFTTNSSHVITFDTQLRCQYLMTSDGPQDRFELKAYMSILDSIDDNLCVDNEIPLNIENCFGNVAYWEIKRPNQNYSLISGSENINQPSFFYNDFFNDDSGIGTTVFFRAKLIGVDIFTQPISITFIGCSPQLIPSLTTTTDQTCYSNTDGTVTLTFDDNVDTANDNQMRYFIYQGDPNDFDPDDIEKPFPPQAYDEILGINLTDDDGDGNFEGTATGLEGSFTDTNNVTFDYADYYIIYQEVLYDPNGIDVTVKSGEITPKFTIERPSQILASGSITAPQSCGDTAKITFSAVGGNNLDPSGNYTYQYRLNGGTWTSATQNPQPIIQGSAVQNVEVKAIYSIGNCESNPVALTGQIDAAPPALTLTNPSPGVASSNSTNDGVISVDYDGGIPNYLFELAKLNGVSSVFEPVVNPTIFDNAFAKKVEFQDLSVGNYRIAITDSNGCSLTTEGIGDIQVTAAPIPQLQDPVTTPIFCNNGSDGGVSAVLDGTINPYQYRILDASLAVVDTGNDITSPLVVNNLSAGDFTIEVIYDTGDFGIPATVASKTFSIANPDPVVINLVNVVGLDCNGSSGGYIEIQVSEAGNFEYSYRNLGDWIDLDASGRIPIIQTSTFNDLLVRKKPRLGDIVFCTSNEIDDIFVPDGISVTEIIGSHQNVSTIGGNEGAIVIDVIGGNNGLTPIYRFQWTGTLDNGGTYTNDTDQNIQNLFAGTYSVTVYDEKTCEKTLGPIRIDEPGPLTIIDFDKQQDVTCNGLNDGILTATVQGTLPVTYTWILVDGSPNGTEITSETNSNNSATLTGLPPGTYRVSLQDADTGPLFNTTNVVIEEPTGISATIALTPTCSAIASGTITISGVTGGTLDPIPNYSYSIDNGANFQNSNTFTNVAAGDYIIVIEEDGGCTYTETVTIATTPPITWNEGSSTITNVSAQGLFDGLIEPVFDGGFGNLSYVWAGPNVGGITEQSIFDLGPGTYAVTVIDDNGCTLVQPFDITEPGPLSMVINQENNVSCFGANDGSILTTVTGEAPITYTWTEVGVGPLTTTAEDDIENLPPGTYTLTVNDASTTPAITSAEIIITEPNALTAQAFATDILCAGESNGSILVTASEGTPTYEYSIDGGVNYQTSNTFPSLTVGNYTLRVQDANGCTFDVPAIVNEPLPIDINIDLQKPLSAAGAEDGAISITAFGGTGNLTYSWSGPAGSYDPTSPIISNLAGGDYVVTITDENYNPVNPNACSFVSETITIAEPGELTASIAQTILLECNGDDFAEITANVQGGVTPYTFEWFQIENGNNSTLVEDTETLGNLSAGAYFVRVTDANTITVDASSVIIVQPGLLEITVDSITNVLCANDETGAINISVTGGTTPYQYFWDNGETNEDIFNISAGEYTIEIVDANGCLAQEIITINTPPNALQITNSTITNISAYEANDGSISLEISGGLEPYKIDWIRVSDNANVGNQNSISSLAADSYEVTISDANGCAITETYLITQPDVVEETIVQPSCNGFADGSIEVLVNQGNGAFTYSWDTGETTNNITDLSPGDYTITITGFGDGPLTRTYTLVDPLPLAVDLGEDRTLCVDQELVLNATVADETATYTWTSDNGFSSAESMITVTTTGTYSVLVETATSCTTTGAVTIDVSTDEISAEFAVSSQVFVGETVVAVDISYPLPESMEWVLPEGAEILKQDSDEVELVFAEPGNYEIGIVTQLGNCTAIQTKSVLVVAKDGTIDDNDAENQQQLIEDFIVYPNPSDGRFTADIKLTERGNISIKVFNLANNALMASVKDRGETVYSIPFDISGLPSGVYAVLLETPYGNSLRKMIVR